jgi:hypothetical protein
VHEFKVQLSAAASNDSAAELLEIMQLVSMLLSAPPPVVFAKFPKSVQSFKKHWYTPPPSLVAMFPMMVQLVRNTLMLPFCPATAPP